MRLFFCVELEAAVREALEEVTRGLRSRLGPGTKWVMKENLHITVRFIGEVEEALAERLAELGSRVAREATPFAFVLSHLGAFPIPRRARVIWAGPEGDPRAFVELVQSVEAGVRELGLPPERKEARAHVTLARLKPPRDVAAALAGVSFPRLTVEVGALTLMRSRLTPQGPIYTPVGRWPLGGGE